VNFLRSPYARVLTMVLVLQSGLFYALAMRPENTPPMSPLSTFPISVPNYRMVREIATPKEILDILKADDTLTREYMGATHIPVLLYIAYFSSQRYGQAPHSPKNCLPGEGFEPIDSSTIQIAAPGWPTNIEVNRFVVQHGDDKEVTLYWYQSHNRVIAHEFSAKFWLVADSIRYHRSDSALVRVIVPVVENDVDSATHVGVDFVQSMFPSLLGQLPQ
jgi:EpsI family protein